MHGIIKLIQIVSIVVLLATFSAVVHGSNGSTGAQVLDIVPDARTTAMGEVFCGIADDVNCLHYNPAGLATIDNIEVPLYNGNWMDMNHQYMGIAYSLQDVRTVNVIDMGTIAVSFNDFNSGEIDGRDATGVYEGKFTARDQVATIAYGKTVFEEEKTGKIMAGAAVKLITEEIKDENASGMSYDLGVLWKLPYYGLTAGAAVQNYGKKIKYSNEDFNLPANIKAGMSVKMFNESLLLGFDINNPRNSSMRLNLGGEYYFMDTIAIRLGYNPRFSEGHNITTGLGLNLKQLDILTFFARDVNIDYAFIPFGDAGDIHKLSITLKLGAD